jgi:hypothetical protein
MAFDENFCVPLRLLDPGSSYPARPDHRERRQSSVAGGATVLRFWPNAAGRGAPGAELSVVAGDATRVELLTSAERRRSPSRFRSPPST